jgi:hypothetical protein
VGDATGRVKLGHVDLTGGMRDPFLDPGDGQLDQAAASA